MEVGSKLYELYTFFINYFNLRRKDDRELYEWLHSQFRYESYKNGVVLQINEYDGNTIEDYTQKVRED